MEQYKNLGGDSGVVGFEIGHDLINVKFHDGWAYRYSYLSAGSNNVEEMQKLAIQGEGLNEYINKHVRKKYESKYQ